MRNSRNRRTTLSGTVLAIWLVMGGFTSATAGAQEPRDTPGAAAAHKDNGAAESPAEEFSRHMKDGVLNNSLGRHSMAEKAFRSALDLCQVHFGPVSAKCGDVSLRLALELSNQERFEEADLQFGQTEKIIGGSKSPLDLPRFHTYRAVDLANRRQFEEAMRLVTDANQKRKAFLKTAFQNARTAEPEAKRKLDHTLTDLAHGLYVQANIAFRLGKLKEARITAFLVRQLISKADTIPDWWIAFADTLIANIDLREGNVEAAEKRLKLALKTKQIALGNTRAVALSYMALGAVFRDGERNVAAVETSRPGLSILRGELRQAPGIRIERLEPFLQSAYATALREPGQRSALHAEMFAAAQLVQTSQTAQTVGQMAARFASDKPEIAGMVRDLQYLTQQRDQLRISLGQATVSSAGNPDATRIEALKTSYTRVAKDVSALETRISKVFPNYSDLVSPAPVGAESVAATLKPDEALVYFIFGDQGGYVFAVRPGGVSAAALDLKRSDIAGMIRSLREPFEKPGPRVAQYDMKLAHRLYRKLLGPVEEALSDVKHLIVVSSNELLSLPLSLLIVDPPPDGGDRYRNAAWLIRKHAVTQMPSVRTFASFRNTIKPSGARLPFIGFGNPAFSGRTRGAGMAALSEHCQVGAAVPAGLLRSLTALPETATELKRVATALGAGGDSIILGADVTEPKVRGLSLDQYRIVYFATHGLLPGELRCQSQPALALSPPENAGSDRASDGLLEASEIATLKLDADLVVLSACNTGGGGSGKLGGESLSGLARAFFQAGTRSILVSHWQVDTVATARLMTSVFDTHSKQSEHHIARALQRSQIKLLADRETAHPYFWASFTLVGEGRATAPPSVASRDPQPGQSPPTQ